MSPQAPVATVCIPLGQITVTLSSSDFPLLPSDVICGQGMNKKHYNEDYNREIVAHRLAYANLRTGIKEIEKQKKEIEKEQKKGALKAGHVAFLTDQKKSLENKSASILIQIMTGRRFFEINGDNHLVLINQVEDFKMLKEKIASALRDARTKNFKRARRRVSRRRERARPGNSAKAPVATGGIESHALTKCIDAVIQNRLRSNDDRLVDDIENHLLTKCIDAAMERTLRVAPDSKGANAGVPV